VVATEPNQKRNIHFINSALNWAIRFGARQSLSEVPI
jgi:hypothetical protein